MASDAAMFATSTDITDEDIEEARSWIGRPLRLPARYNTVATSDSIRHFALAFGDDNPLWCEPAYGATTERGTVLAPPTWLYSVFAPGIGPGFGGLQSFYAGGRWEFVRPVVPGEEIIPTAQLVDVKEVTGRRSGRTIIQSGLTEYRTAAGDLAATNLSRTFRKPRAGLRDSVAVEPYERQISSPEELEDLEDRLLAYQRRGDQPRLWEDTQVGATIEERIKGPLQLNDIYLFSVNVGIVAAGPIALRRRRIAMVHPETAPTNRPVEWLTNRTPAGQGHFDQEAARAVGVPTMYDNGWLRLCWMAQVVTDWMGDDAFLKSIEAKLRLPNLLGDVLFINGSVVGSRVDAAGDHVVDLDFLARRQDGETSCTVTATVQLPTNA